MHRTILQKSTLNAIWALVSLGLVPNAACTAAPTDPGRDGAAKVIGGEAVADPSPVAAIYRAKVEDGSYHLGQFLCSAVLFDRDWGALVTASHCFSSFVGALVRGDASAGLKDKSTLAVSFAKEPGQPDKENSIVPIVHVRHQIPGNDPAGDEKAWQATWEDWQQTYEFRSYWIKVTPPEQRPFAYRDMAVLYLGAAAGGAEQVGVGQQESTEQAGLPAAANLSEQNFAQTTTNGGYAVIGYGPQDTEASGGAQRNGSSLLDVKTFANEGLSRWQLMHGRTQVPEPPRSNPPTPVDGPALGDSGGCVGSGSADDDADSPRCDRIHGIVLGPAKPHLEGYAGGFLFRAFDAETIAWLQKEPSQGNGPRSVADSTALSFEYDPMHDPPED